MTHFPKKIAVIAIATGLTFIAYISNSPSLMNSLSASCHDKGGKVQEISTVRMEGVGCYVPSSNKIAPNTMTTQIGDHQQITFKELGYDRPKAS